MLWDLLVVTFAIIGVLFVLIQENNTRVKQLFKAASILKVY